MRARLQPLIWLLPILISGALTIERGALFGQGLKKKSSTGNDVKVNQGELTLDVRNQPLAQVLREIAAQANLKLTLCGDLSAPVTQSFAAVPLDEAIKRLAREFSFALTATAQAHVARRSIDERSAELKEVDDG